jgi:hypothetical protein
VAIKYGLISFLYISINKKPVFFLQVVSYETATCGDVVFQVERPQFLSRKTGVILIFDSSRDILHLHPESTASTVRFLNPDSSSVKADNLLDNSQAYPGTSNHFSRCTSEEDLKNAAALSDGDARAVVSNKKAHHLPAALSPYLDRATLPAGITDGIADQVVEYLGQEGLCHLQSG